MMEQSLIPLTSALPLTAQRTVKRALTLLDRHLAKQAWHSLPLRLPVTG